MSNCGCSLVILSLVEPPSLLTAAITGDYPVKKFNSGVYFSVFKSFFFQSSLVSTLLIYTSIPFYFKYENSNHQNENSKFQNEKNAIDL